MQKDIADGAIGTVGKYDLEYKDGAVTFDAAIAFGPGSLAVTAKLDAIDVAILGLTILDDKIQLPGNIDKVMIDGLKSALLALK